MYLTKEDLQREVTYKTSRSGGKGGQNVNKVSSKVEILFSLVNSALFSEDDKQWLSQQLASKINNDGNLQIICEEERSQYLNKQRAIDRLYNLLIRSLHRPKVRKASQPSKAMKAKRLEQKRINSIRKQLRRNDFDF
jgi:ribosome-associated protein